MENPFYELQDQLKSISTAINHLQSGETQKPKFVDIEGAAEIRKCSKSKIYKETMNSEIPFYKDGRRLLFKVSELESMIEMNKSTPQQQGIKVEK